MTRFKKIKTFKPNILAGVFCSVLLLAGLGGCTVGMFGDISGPAQAEIVGNTFPAIDPANVEIKDLIPAGGDSVSPETISKYESSLKGVKIAKIMGKGTGYGDVYQKAIDKIRNKAAKLGANLVLITSKNKPSGDNMFSSIEGSNFLMIVADAYHTTK